jgi:hypothetical protein
VQLATLLGAERREELTLLLGGERADALQRLLALLGQEDRARAAVAGVGAAFGQATRLVEMIAGTKQGPHGGRGAMIFRPAVRLKSRRNSNGRKAKWHR